MGRTGGILRRDAATPRQLDPEVIMVMFVSTLDAPRRGWDLWRFASLIPSGWRLTPIHKVMGDHASRGSTPGGAFLPRGSLCVIHFVPRKRFRQYRGCMLGHFVPKKRFKLHQMCVLHCSIHIIPYVSPRPRPVRVKTFSTHVVVKKCHVVRKMAGFTHGMLNIELDVRRKRF